MNSGSDNRSVVPRDQLEEPPKHLVFEEAPSHLNEVFGSRLSNLGAQLSDPHHERDEAHSTRNDDGEIFDERERQLKKPYR